MVKVADLPLPASLKECYLRAGIRELYPPQSECIEKGMFEGKNLLVAIPTASGKTLVAEMAMHHHIARRGKCLYIVPLKALASEKFEDFSGKSVKVGISTGDLDRRDEYPGKERHHCRHQRKSRFPPAERRTLAPGDHPSGGGRGAPDRFSRPRSYARDGHHQDAQQEPGNAGDRALRHDRESRVPGPVA